MLLVQMVYCVLGIYGVTQQPETKEYMIVMQYAKNGSLPTYLDQNINKLTWKRKLQYLDDIALHLSIIHEGQLVHCDLHGGNIVLTDDKFDNDIQPVICDFGLQIGIFIANHFKHSGCFAIYCAGSSLFSQVYSKVGYLFFWHYYASDC
jgi:serine/threonine protein kinase